jgi:hypothetical protein
LFACVLEGIARVVDRRKAVGPAAETPAVDAPAV